ncbi:unnamed protein product [Toxocara canis]|uniref:Uncharacterized protein n=1 Tax=Toxocara canis TaxID=6265 RepID=A0A183VBI9_TOXCA|nr:unnamed protein product [Toxocara canis]
MNWNTSDDSSGIPDVASAHGGTHHSKLSSSLFDSCGHPNETLGQNPLIISDIVAASRVFQSPFSSQGVLCAVQIIFYWTYRSAVIVEENGDYEMQSAGIAK